MSAKGPANAARGQKEAPNQISCLSSEAQDMRGAAGVAKGDGQAQAGWVGR